jgi:hypothetical protein
MASLDHISRFIPASSRGGAGSTRFPGLARPWARPFPEVDLAGDVRLLLGPSIRIGEAVCWQGSRNGEDIRWRGVLVDEAASGRGVSFEDAQAHVEESEAALGESSAALLDPDIVFGKLDALAEAETFRLSRSASSPLVELYAARAPPAARRSLRIPRRAG